MLGINDNTAFFSRARINLGSFRDCSCCKTGCKTLHLHTKISWLRKILLLEKLLNVGERKTIEVDGKLLPL